MILRLYEKAEMPEGMEISLGKVCFQGSYDRGLHLIEWYGDEREVFNDDASFERQGPGRQRYLVG